jgi:hypothetical protein
MIEISDNEKQTRFFLLRESSAYTAEARGTILWAQNRIKYLETIAKNLKTEVQQLTDQLIGKSTSQESDEDRHQRHRRERMLDEVTLMCIALKIEIITNNLNRFGEISRDAAADICNGINQYDAEH